MQNLLDDQLFESILNQAKHSPRKRSHFNFHKELSDPVQRVCIGLLKGTYVRPHYHPQQNKWEMLLAVSGCVGVLIFNDQGFVVQRYELAPQQPLHGIELQPDTWHTVFPVTSEAVILEVKEGPYLPTAAENFAAWSPEEGSSAAAEFLDWAESARVGDKFQPTAND